MKLFLHFVLILLISMQFQPTTQIDKILRFDCNTTAIIIKNARCRVRSLSRESQTFDIGFEIIKKVNSLYMDVVVMLKSLNGLSWRQIIKLQKIDLCMLWRGGNLDSSMDIAKALRNFYVSTFPELPSKCPVYPGNYSTRKLTADTYQKSFNSSDKKLKDSVSNRDDLDYNIKSAMTPAGNLPNGIYRYVFRFHNDEDPQGFVIYWQTKIYKAMGEDEF